MKKLILTSAILFSSFLSLHASELMINQPESKIVELMGIPDNKIEVGEQTFYEYDKCKNVGFNITSTVQVSKKKCKERILTVEKGIIVNDTTVKKRHAK